MKYAGPSNPYLHIPYPYLVNMRMLACLALTCMDAEVDLHRACHLMHGVLLYENNAKLHKLGDELAHAYYEQQESGDMSKVPDIRRELEQECELMARCLSLY